MVSLEGTASRVLALHPSNIWSSSRRESASTTKTANLVRLLRAVEEGKGLETDYGEALDEALLQSKDEDDPFIGGGTSKGLKLLARVPVLGIKRSSRVIPGVLGGEHDVAGFPQERRRRQQQQRQQQKQQQKQKQKPKQQPKQQLQRVEVAARRRLGRQPEAAPSDGGLIRVFSPPLLTASSTRRKKSPGRASGGGGDCGGVEAIASLSRRKPSKIFTSKRETKNGAPPPPLSSSRPASPPSFARLLLSNGSESIQITEDRVRRVYADLCRQGQLNSATAAAATAAAAAAAAAAASPADETKTPVDSSRQAPAVKNGVAAGETETTGFSVPKADCKPVGGHALSSSPAAGHLALDNESSPTIELSTTVRLAIPDEGSQTIRSGGYQETRPGAPPGFPTDVALAGSTASLTRAGIKQRVGTTTSLAADKTALLPLTTVVGAQDIAREKNAKPKVKLRIDVGDHSSLQRTNQITVETYTAGQPAVLGSVILGGGRDSTVSSVEPQAIKLSAGLGSWADGAAVVGRLLDEDSRRVTEAIEREEKRQQGLKQALEQEMGNAVKGLPLSFLKSKGYKREAQREGAEKMARVVDGILSAIRTRAWKRWRQRLESRRKSESTSHKAHATALARGHLARKRVAKMRRAKEEAARKDPKIAFLQRRVAKVSAASRVVASCLIANAASRRRRRREEVRAAVAIVERVFLSRKTRKQGLREIAQYHRESSAAALIQRWTRGVLVRRRVPLDRRIRRMAKADARFAVREEVVASHLVEHGAAVVIQKWWRSLRWRMRRLRRRYRYLLGQRAGVIQRAYRRHLRRQNRKTIGQSMKDAGGAAVAAVLSSVMEKRADVGARLAGAMRTTTTTTPTTIPTSAAAAAAEIAAAAQPAPATTEVSTPVSGRSVHAPKTAAAAAASIASRFQRAAEAITRADAGARARAALRLMVRSLPQRGERKERDAAAVIQGLVMVRIAHRKLLKKREERRQRAATTIQTFVRDLTYNAMISRRRDLFRSVCQHAVIRSKAKQCSGKAIGGLGRRFMQRRKYVKTRRSVIKCQAVVRGWLGRRLAESRLVYTQDVGEARAAGAVRWEQLLRRREEEELVNGARMEDLGADLELQKVFMKYCRFGDRRNEGRMVEAKLTALCKDAGITDAKRFPAPRVGISFAKVKSKDLSYLPYASFLAVLDDITAQHSEVKRLAKKAVAVEADERVATTTASTIPAATSTAVARQDNHNGSGLTSSSGSGLHGEYPGSDRHEDAALVPNNKPSRSPNGIKSPRNVSTPGSDRGETSIATVTTTAATAAAAESPTGEGGEGPVGGVNPAAGFGPNDQRLLVALQHYVLVKSDAGREVCEELKSAGRGARHRALMRLEAAAIHVQACVARGCYGRGLASEERKRRGVERGVARVNWAASVIQTRVRAFQARVRVSKLALTRYYRCLDGLTEAEYYFDPKTGESSWTKPKVLGKLSIPTVVVVPAGEEIMVPVCRECEQEPATEICADCDEDVLCGVCANRIHATGNFTAHLRVTIDKCEECSFQVAVKTCKQCGDNFCMSCFKHVHRKGRLRRHTFDPLVPMCDDCGDRAQAFRCFGCEPEGRLLLCKPCQEARHWGLPAHELSFHRIEQIGFRSVKVQRLKADKASRAKELWMKAESAAAFQKKVDKERLKAAIKIQAVWRGRLARKRRKLMMEQHLLWRMQRLKDDLIRKTRRYKILLFVGKAPLLKSDTNQEMVLKQYPRWWQTTIIDIIKPGLGWHDAAKMVREQEFFANKVRRQGRRRVLAARVRVSHAREMLRRSEKDQRKLQRMHARAAEAYQHARAEGGVGAKEKDGLQQASRKAKRAVKAQEEERKKVEAALHKAEDKLEALIGPFRLRETVRTAMTRGMLMPFPVSVQRGKGSAKLERDQPMREVLKWMPYGRRVRIEPLEESLPPPPAHSLGPFFVRGVKEAQQKLDVAVAAAGDVTSIVPPTEARVDSEGTAPSGQAAHAELPAAALPGCPSLVLDRQWLLPDASLCRAYGMPILPLPQRAAMIVSTGIRDSTPVQTILKAGVVAAHVQAERLEMWQTKFDDDSPMHARLERWAAGSEYLSASLMLRRLRLFDVDTGFDMRRRAARIIRQVEAAWNRAQKMADAVKSAAATELVSKQQAGGKGAGLIGGALDRELVQQLFKKWLRSDDKDEVVIMHRSGPQTGEAVEEVVKSIKIDLDTPTVVVREFIRRFCGEWLNEHAKGHRFVIENSKGVVIRRSTEGRKGAATAMDMVQERVNKSTRDTEAVIFVRDQADPTDPDATVEPLLIPPEEILDPAATPALDDDDIDVDDDEGDEHPGSWRSSEVSGVEAKQHTRGRNGGRLKRTTKMKASTSGNAGDGDGNGEMSDYSYSDNSGSIGSMGSDLDEVLEEDPFAAMEQDELDKKEEVEKVKQRAAAAGMS